MPYCDYFQDPPANASLEEKIAIIKSNRASAIKMLANLKECKRISNNNLEYTTKVSTSPSLISKPQEENEDIRNPLNKISLMDIEGFSEEDIVETMRTILKDYNLNQTLIDRLKLLLYKEVIVYSKMLLTTSDAKEKQELEQVIDAIYTKIDLLDELDKNQDVSAEELCDTTSNNIFFLISDSGNVVLQESLRKDFPREFYPLVKELILRIKNGNIHKVKRLTGVNYLQLRLNEVRITFERLSRGNYIIFDAFVKKHQNNKYGVKKLRIRLDQFNNKKSFYVENHQKEEFIEEHEGYLAEILTLLDSKTLSGDEQDEKRNI